MSLTRVCTAVLALFALTAVIPVSRADTYRVYEFSNNDRYRFVNADDFGDVVLDVSYDSASSMHPMCGTVVGATTCYETFYHDAPVTYTTTVPSLPGDPNAIPGSGCPASPTLDFTLVECDNGHPFYRGIGGLYTGPSEADHIGFGSFDGGIETENGNLYFTDGALDELDVAIDLTTTSAATTPEPSSFALLGTGLLGAIGVARKRFA